jgi:hypothetical protein
MKILNAERAIISREKIIRYLLNTEHKRGGSKAALLVSFGYTVDDWRRLADGLRAYHLTVDATVVRETPYGTRYEIRAPLTTPDGRSLNVRSIWQIDIGTDYPRFITLFPD